MPTEIEKEEATSALIEAEKYDTPLANRSTVGDASESGLIKFVQTL